VLLDPPVAAPPAPKGKEAARLPDFEPDLFFLTQPPDLES
jgi:hypothetical protein